jgi:hypothetical protein
MGSISKIEDSRAFLGAFGFANYGKSRYKALAP